MSPIIDPRSIRIAVFCYRLALWLYPRAFRQTFGPEMAQIFREWSRAAYHGAGTRGLVQVWMRTCLDLLTTIPRQHFAAIVEWRSRPTLTTLVAIKGGVMLQYAPFSRRDLLHHAAWQSLPLILGFLIQWVLWVLPSADRGWVGLESCFMLAGITGLLIGYAITINYLIARHQINAGRSRGIRQHQPVISWHSKTLFICASVLYMALVVLMPMLVPHTASLHDRIWYNSGVLGTLYAFVATLTMLLKGVVLIPCAAGVAGQAARVWRTGDRVQSKRWLMLAGAMLLIAIVTRTESHAYSNWFMD